MSGQTEAVQPETTNETVDAMVALLEGNDDTPETEPEEQPAPETESDDDAEDVGDSEAESEGSEDTPEGEDAETPTLPEVDEDELISDSHLDDALAAFDAQDVEPEEAVAFARKALRSVRAARNKANRHYQNVANRQRKLNRKLDDHKRDSELFYANKADFEARVKKIQSGDPEMVLRTLDSFGISYDDITNAIIGDTSLRRGKPSAEVQELKEKLEQLQRDAQENNKRQQQAYQQEILNQARKNIGELASDEDKYPFLSDEQPSEVVEAVFSYIGNHYQETGEELDPEDVLNELEGSLRQKTERRLKRFGASIPSGDSGRETRADKAKPGKPRRSAPSKKTSSEPDFSKMTEAQRNTWLAENI